MDTSKEYIEMCQKAVEIQPKLGNFFTFKYDTGSFFYHDLSKSIRTNKGTMFEDGKDIWLPRQDQLQEILKGFFDCTHENLRDAFEVFHNNKPVEWEIWTNEQLWLAFVMHEKYGKKWDGEDWIKKGNFDINKDP